MWEIFQQDLTKCIQQLNQQILIWQQKPIKQKAIAELINAFQKLVAGGLLLQANEVVTLIKNLQQYLETNSLEKTPLSDKSNDTIQTVSTLLLDLAKNEVPQTFYQSNIKQFNKTNSLLVDLKEDIPNNNTDTAQENTIRLENDITEEVPSTPETFNAINIVAIFKQELAANVEKLIAAVLKIEQGIARIDDYKEMMRYAHSLKGGARLAGLDHVVNLAHNLEDIFTKVQKGEHQFRKNDIDLLMQLIDMLTTLTQAYSSSKNNNEINNLLSTIDSLFNQLLSKSSDVDVNKSAVISESEPILTNTKSEESERTNTNLSNTTASTEVHLQKIISLVSDMKIDAQLSVEMSKNFRHLYRELSAMSSKIQSTNGHFEQNNVESLNHIIQSCRDLFEKYEEFRVENSNKIQRLSKSAIACRMGEFNECLTGIPRLIRDLAKAQGKQVALIIHGTQTPVDRNILAELNPVLIHLVQNAIDHGILAPEQRKLENKNEEATLTISAQHRSGYLIINVADDGKGIDLNLIKQKIIAKKMVAENTISKLSEEELLSFIFLPQFTLKEEVTQVSGRGVGLDVVHNFIVKSQGKLKVNNKPGFGVDFEFRLPVSVATIRCVIVRVGEEIYAIPVYQIEQVTSLSSNAIYYIEGRPVIKESNTDVYLFDGYTMLNIGGNNKGLSENVVILKSTTNLFGFMVDEILDELELVDRPLHPGLGKLKDVRTASAMPDGTPVLILDVEDLITGMDKSHTSVSAEKLLNENNNLKAKRVLVVDDSITIREVQRNMLEAQGYQVDVAVDGIDGWNNLRQNTYNLLITDIDMPRLNGWGLLEKVKNHVNLKNIPVIIVSYKDNEGDFERGLEAGADSYISKGSFQDNSFIQIVNDLIGTSTASRVN